jgi:hypothetical protein
MTDPYFLGVSYSATDWNISSSGIELPGFLVNYHIYIIIVNLPYDLCVYSY